MSTARWTLLTFLAALAVAVLSLPSSSEHPEAHEDPLRRALSEANARWQLHSELLRRAHSREIAMAAVKSAPATDESFALVGHTDVPAPFADRVRAAMSNALRELPQRDPGTRIVVALAVDTASTLAGAHAHRGNQRWSADIFAPGVVADDACTIVVRAHSNAMLSAPVSGSRRTFIYEWADIAGACWWYGAYGRPGRGVASWIDSAGIDAIGGAGRNIRNSMLLFRSVDEMRCRAGHDGTCETLLLNRRGVWSVRGVSPPLGTTTVNRRGSGPGFYLSSILLDRLHADLGPVEFAKLWKSDDPVPVSFAALRGEPLSAWVRRQAVAAFGEYRAGPFGDVGWTAILLGIPALIGLGVFGVVRRGTLA
jgi:hypothetical protein